jgi:ethanolamine phosphate transferase 2 subunit G
MRDSGGHSGNSFAETHIPMLIIGGDCESNREKFYKQIDFAGTFSILNGLPIPSASIGSIIPEMFFNMTPIQKLDKLKMVNERLMKMVKGDGSEEFKLQFQKARTFHQMFDNDSNNKNAFLQAESNYLTSSRAISDQLSQRSLDVNLFQVLLGLVFNILICTTILIPSDGLVKDVKLSLKSFLPFVIGSFVLKLFIFNEIFHQSNGFCSFIVMAVMSMVLRVVLSIIDAKCERFKWFHLFDNDLLYLLMLGHFFFIVSVGSSSFVEEEHQLWYYFCNSMFVILTFFEFRGRTSVRSFFGVFGKCFSFLLLHVVIRRMNQTGDKWINAPDLNDFFQSEINKSWLHLLVILSLFASAAWLVFIHCTKPSMVLFIVLGNVLLYFHHTRSINNR